MKGRNTASSGKAAADSRDGNSDPRLGRGLRPPFWSSLFFTRGRGEGDGWRVSYESCCHCHHRCPSSFFSKQEEARQACGWTKLGRWEAGCQDPALRQDFNSSPRQSLGFVLPISATVLHSGHCCITWGKGDQFPLSLLRCSVAYHSPALDIMQATQPAYSSMELGLVCELVLMIPKAKVTVGISASELCKKH